MMRICTVLVILVIIVLTENGVAQGQCTEPDAWTEWTQWSSCVNNFHNRTRMRCDHSSGHIQIDNHILQCNPCVPNPCSEDGTCKVLSKLDFSCQYDTEVDCPSQIYNGWSEWSSSCSEMYRYVRNRERSFCENGRIVVEIEHDQCPPGYCNEVDSSYSTWSTWTECDGNKLYVTSSRYRCYLNPYEIQIMTDSQISKCEVCSDFDGTCYGGNCPPSTTEHTFVHPLCPGVELCCIGKGNGQGKGKGKGK